MNMEHCVPKLIGGDIELGNFILGRGHSGDQSDREASRLLLAEVDGLPLGQAERSYTGLGVAFGSIADGRGY